jgi:hypothetical protein
VRQGGNVDTLFFMRDGTCFTELVFLHLVGSAGHVVQSGASGARNIDALFFILADEDIINMDTPTVVAYNLKVKVFFSKIIFNTCDQWTLHQDMCSMSFTEVHTWIKEGVDHAWKGWIRNTWIGDQIRVLPTLPPCHHITCGIRKQGDQV